MTQPPRRGGFLSLVALIRNIIDEGLQVDCALQCAMELNVDACVGIVAIVFDDAVPHRLEKDVSVSWFELTCSQTPIEVVIVAAAAPEGNASLRPEIVDKLRNRAVQLARHWTELLSIGEVTQHMVVIVQQRGDDRNKTVQLRVVVESIPEDLFRWLTFKCRIAIPTTRGDEVDAVIAIPMFELVLSLEELMSGLIALSEARHDPKMPSPQRLCHFIGTASTAPHHGTYDTSLSTSDSPRTEME